MAYGSPPIPAFAIVATHTQNAAGTALSGPGQLRRRALLPVRGTGSCVLRAEGDVREVLVQAKRPPIRLWDAPLPAAAVRGAAIYSYRSFYRAA